MGIIQINWIEGASIRKIIEINGNEGVREIIQINGLMEVKGPQGIIKI